MTNLVYAPNRWHPDSGVSVFLAGSIEMGKAEEWQDAVAERLLQNEKVATILNPRRKDWDSSWVQSMDNFHFRQQVEWELVGVEKADIVFFNILPDTKSPITLMELGHRLSYSGDAPNHLVVCCPDGFWRKGNVDVICHRHGIHVYRNVNDAMVELEQDIDDIHYMKYRR